MNGIPNIDPSSSPDTVTLKGIRRTSGNAHPKACAVTVPELKSIFTTLDMNSSEDIGFWLAAAHLSSIVLQGSIQQVQMVEPGLAVFLSDVEVLYPGVLVSVVH